LSGGILWPGNPSKPHAELIKNIDPIPGLTVVWDHSQIEIGIFAMKTGIFRDELPGERKSIINLLMTGYLVVISILGYMAFYLSIQMGQIDRVIHEMQPASMTADEINVIKARLSMSTNRLSNESKWIAILGGLFSVIGGIYTYNLVIRPLRKLVTYAETGEGELPEIKVNNEIKQLMTAITEGPTPSPEKQDTANS
jgi:hypothetical protein